MKVNGSIVLLSIEHTCSGVFSMNHIDSCILLCEQYQCFVVCCFRFEGGCTNVVSRAPQLTCGDRGTFAVTKVPRSTITSLLLIRCQEGKYM